MNTTLWTTYSLDMKTQPKSLMNVVAFVIALTRVQLPLILFTAAYTSSRSGELVDAGRGHRLRRSNIPLWQQAAGGAQDELS